MMSDFAGYIDDSGIEFDGNFIYEGTVGPRGPQGPAGQDGANGQDGYTPVKGVDYFTEEEIAEIESEAASQVDLSGKQDVLTAGDNITIENNVISATGGGATYTAGSNIQISDQNVISATDTTYSTATTSTAGLMSAADKTKLDNTFKELASPVIIWNLEDGIYLLPASCKVRYGPSSMYWTSSKALLFVGTENSTTKRYFIFNGSGTTNNIVNGKTTENSGTIKYFSVSSDYETTSNKVTSISSSSTNTQYPSALAVYNFGVNNFIGNNVITDIWHGTQAQYEQISPKSATTLYLIDEE